MSAGQGFSIPAGAPHTVVNHTDEEAHFRAYFSPPMRLAALFTELAETGGRPSLAHAARLMRDYRDEFFCFAYVPVGLQRAIGTLVRAAHSALSPR